jgi:hypothetical protein
MGDMQGAIGILEELREKHRFDPEKGEILKAAEIALRHLDGLANQIQAVQQTVDEIKDSLEKIKRDMR